jgi:hypothetical protein
MQALYLGCRGGDKFALVVSTHALLTVIRIVERHIRVFTRHIIRAKTHSGKLTDENKIGVKLAALNIRGLARYKKTLLSGRKHEKGKLIL